MSRKIKFIAQACRWFDKVNGNTYHSVRITRVKDGKVIVAPFQYGYGNQYEYTARQAMAEVKWLPVKYRGKGSHGVPNSTRYEMENNYPIHWAVNDVRRQKDCIANGVL